jgi:hypothetical protein
MVLPLNGGNPGHYQVAYASSVQLELRLNASRMQVVRKCNGNFFSARLRSYESSFFFFFFFFFFFCFAGSPAKSWT